MNLNFRYGIVLILLAGILLLAGNQAAGASVSPARIDEQIQPASGVDTSVEAAKPGTIHPPAGELVITESGTYQIGGFCNYTVEFLSPDISVHVSLERPLPRPLPDKAHAVRQGCRVTYYQRTEGTLIEEFTAEMGSSTICFAAVPGQDTGVYFLNAYSSYPDWGPAEGSGGVCSTARPSGVYVATFEKP